MDKMNKTLCPKCGHKYGISWAFFPARFRKDYPFSIAKECKVCKTPLCVEGDSAKAAKRIKQIAFIPNIVLWVLIGIRELKNYSFSEEHFLKFLGSALIFLLLFYLSILITLYIANYIYLKFDKNAGILSIVSDAKLILKYK